MTDIEVSPIAKDPVEVPKISLSKFLLERLESHLPALADKPWVIDVITGRSVKFGEIDDKSRRVASALSRIGLRRGDILYFVTYDMAHVYVAMMAAWRLGAAVRGCYQKEEIEEYTRQIREGHVLIILVDIETAPKIREACAGLEWKVKLISLGDQTVKGATPFLDLLKDDGTAIPNRIDINVDEDIVFIPNTSGSTGFPKGAMHTHYSIVSLLYGIRMMSNMDSQLTLSSNVFAANFFAVFRGLYFGATTCIVSKYKNEAIFNHILKYKPEVLLIFPYVASWFARTPELSKHDLSFIKAIGLGGSVLDSSTAQLITKAFPNALVSQSYAMSECIGVSLGLFGMNKPANTPLKMYNFEDETYVSVGKLYPYVTAKIVDCETGRMTLGRMKSGEIVIKSPYIMKGYLVQNELPDRTNFDSDGWYHTGDLGFFDEDGYLYIQERKSFMFKYYMHFISPSDIESVLLDHPLVESAGIVGIPNPETTSLARAFVVLRPGAQTTAEELETHVSKSLPSHMHLHGGVTFLNTLPTSREGKLDRVKLKEIAIRERRERTLAVNQLSCCELY